ncbi:hypothetical protein LTR37_000802 [Vermiconidia calcicola]|uniref:Uncharacterized protein n=1 Tax=Vermiconidia calcicola TaxID=1690605 RepID=A0ACC3NZT9_9PEZI|nr:hypothetical protein LTR37_000802 [Vermiconidia calcicola]
MSGISNQFLYTRISEPQRIVFAEQWRYTALRYRLTPFVIDSFNNRVIAGQEDAQIRRALMMQGYLGEQTTVPLPVGGFMFVTQYGTFTVPIANRSLFPTNLQPNAVVVGGRERERGDQGNAATAVPAIAAIMPPTAAAGVGHEQGSTQGGPFDLPSSVASFDGSNSAAPFDGRSEFTRNAQTALQAIAPTDTAMQQPTTQHNGSTGSAHATFINLTMQPPGSSDRTHATFINLFQDQREWRQGRSGAALPPNSDEAQHVDAQARLSQQSGQSRASRPQVINLRMPQHTSSGSGRPQVTHTASLQGTVGRQDSTVEFGYPVASRRPTLGAGITPELRESLGLDARPPPGGTQGTAAQSEDAPLQLRPQLERIAPTAPILPPDPEQNAQPVLAADTAENAPATRDYGVQATLSPLLQPSTPSLNIEVLTEARSPRPESTAEPTSTSPGELPMPPLFVTEQGTPLLNVDLPPGTPPTENEPVVQLPSNEVHLQTIPAAPRGTGDDLDASQNDSRATAEVDNIAYLDLLDDLDLPMDSDMDAVDESIEALQTADETNSNAAAEPTADRFTGSINQLVNGDSSLPADEESDKHDDDDDGPDAFQTVPTWSLTRPLIIPPAATTNKAVHAVSQFEKMIHATTNASRLGSNQTQPRRVRRRPTPPGFRAFAHALADSIGLEDTPKWPLPSVVAHTVLAARAMGAPSLRNVELEKRRRDLRTRAGPGYMQGRYSLGGADDSTVFSGSEYPSPQASSSAARDEQPNPTSTEFYDQVQMSAGYHLGRLSALLRPLQRVTQAVEHQHLRERAMELLMNVAEQLNKQRVSEERRPYYQRLANEVELLLGEADRPRPQQLQLSVQQSAAGAGGGQAGNREREPMDVEMSGTEENLEV